VHEDEQPRLVASLADRHVLILRNHGLLVAGPDLPTAFWLLWTLQRACEVQAMSDAMGGANAPVSEAVAQGCRQDAARFDARIAQLVFDAALPTPRDFGARTSRRPECSKGGGRRTAGGVSRVGTARRPTRTAGCRRARIPRRS
jgi:hypothetical protein